MADTIDLDSMAVDDKYTGPRIPDSGVDTNFMKVYIFFNLQKIFFIIRFSHSC